MGIGDVQDDEFDWLFGIIVGRLVYLVRGQLAACDAAAMAYSNT